jgi:SNF2 family DNA or RNA helicase
MELKPHQARLVETYHEDFRPVLLAGCVGSGKTGTAIILDKLRRERFPRKNPTLIVCPKTLVQNWVNEIRLWVGEGAVVLCDLTPTKRAKLIKSIEENPPRWVIANYDTVRIEWEFFQKHHWYHIIVDEAHNIKNRQTGRAVAIKGANAYSRMALTGTPIANRPYDLWSLLHFLEPGSEYIRNGVRYHKAGRWGTYNDFCSHHCYLNPWGQFEGSRDLLLLHDNLISSGLMVRWKREEILPDLDPIKAMPVGIEMTTSQRKLYEQLRAGFFAWPDKDGRLTTKQITNVLAQLTYFRRCTSMSPKSFSQSLAGKMPGFAPNLHIPNSGDNCKLTHIKDLLQYTLDEQEKIVILTNWRDSAFELEQELKEYDPQIVMGGVNNRQDRVDTFNNSNSRVFIGTSAAFEGLNLQSSHHIVWNDLPWGPKEVTQGNGRIDRIGQDKPCTAFYLLAEDTIDSRVFNIIKGKATDVNDAIDGGVGDEILQFPWTDIV